MASTLVDDSDYHVQYQPGWIWEQGVAEVRATRHGAAIPGLRAWLPFTGTGVRVVGTLGPSDTYGQPRTTYLLDGEVAGTYDAPHTGQVRYNVTFFEARGLQPGDHIITVNNTDGAPNTFWLDYILVDPEPEEGQVTSTTTTTSTTKGTGPTPDPDPDPPARESGHSSSSSTVSSRSSSSSSPTSTTGSTASSGSRSLMVTPNASATSNAFSSGASNSTISVSLVTSGSGDATVVSTVSVTLPVGAAAQTSAANTNSDVGGAGAGTGSDAAAQGESHSDAGVIAGAAVAGIAVVVIVVVVYLFLRRRRRPRKTPDTVPQFTYSSDNPGATLRPTSSHQSAAASPSAYRSVESLSESYTPSPSSSSALLVPMRQSSPPLPPVPPPPPQPVSEKSGQSSSSPDTPTSGFSTESRTRSESTRSSDMVETRSTSSTSLSTLMPAAAVLPPGAWHAPPDAHGRAQTLLRSLFSRGARAERGEDVVTVSRDVDSGLRLYDEVVLPPPYTQD